MFGRVKFGSGEEEVIHEEATFEYRPEGNEEANFTGVWAKYIRQREEQHRALVGGAYHIRANRTVELEPSEQCEHECRRCERGYGAYGCCK